MHINYRQQIPFKTLCITLMVMGFCFLPHILSTPWWLTLFAVFTVIYQLTAHYYYLPLPPKWIRILLILLLTLLLKLQFGSFFSSGFFIGALLGFFWLKIIEIQTLRDIKAVLLASFYVIFTALIIHAKLWILIYLILAIGAILFLALKLALPTVAVAPLVKKSFKFLLTALPITILMFFLFPRVNPLWQVAPPPQGHTAFKEEMSPGSLASLTPDDSTVMRITFKEKIKNKNQYWYGLILDHYDGLGWKKTSRANLFLPLPILPSKQSADYEIILEPHEKKWLFYIKNPKDGWPRLQFSPSLGLTRWNSRPVTRRFAYALTTQKTIFLKLSTQERQSNLQLPPLANNRLKTWAKEKRLKFHGDNTQFVNEILSYIHQKPFWYTLNPKPIGSGNQQLDRFWFDTQEGYCEHYASAVTFILRAAGIPARVALGYYGGEWNPLGEYLRVRQKDAHAWLEYWQDNDGWKHIDPTAYIAKERIDQSILEDQKNEQAMYGHWETYRIQLSWLTHARLTLDSVRFFWERWLLFYNQDKQQALMKSLGLGDWRWSKLFQYWIASLLLFMMILWLAYLLKQKKTDPLRREYQRLQKEFSKLDITPNPPASFIQQMHLLAVKKPNLDELIKNYIKQYETIRLNTKKKESSSQRQAIYHLLKKLRKIIKNN